MFLRLSLAYLFGMILRRHSWLEQMFKKIVKNEGRYHTLTFLKYTSGCVMALIGNQLHIPELRSKIAPENRIYWPIYSSELVI